MYNNISNTLMFTDRINTFIIKFRYASSLLCKIVTFLFSYLNFEPLNILENSQTKSDN